MRLRLVTACCGLICLMAALQSHASVEIDSNTFGGIRARSIGPAVMSGRIATLDAHVGETLTLYVGAATGGVWKSSNAGTTFEPVFDDHGQAIGAIRIDPNDLDTVWVGTGESWVRNSVSVGTGVYKTTDGGKNWESVGLTDSERISMIHVDPTDSDTVYVCATGHLWNDNEERGVYKTTDGGESWERILYADPRTGCADLSMDPQDPKILYASMWEFRRSPDFFSSGGPGSALYRTQDGGENWEKLTEGLPEGELGRIAVAVAPSRPSTIFATVEAKETALYRSDDLGNHWRKVNSSFNVQARPFYFSRLVVDPSDLKNVYKPGLTLSVSRDGGESFSSPFGSGFGGNVHSDHHAVWVHPQDSNWVIIGTDGGLYVSHDGARSFRFSGALPISQFYHVSYDMEEPYNVMGGLQDNGTWIGPSQAPGGIRNKHWKTIGQGDGFWALVDPKDPDYIYVEYQGGMLSRYRKSRDELKDIRPLETPGDPDYRFNWNTPIHLGRGEQGALFYGAQFLFHSADRGESWQKISPDLTTNDPQRQRQAKSGGLSPDNTTAENNATIFSIDTSPMNEELVWVGTDDGLVHVTTDLGKNWTNVTANLPDLPEGTWISRVVASSHSKDRAYVTADGHRHGDMATYVYRTDDLGATWRSITTDGIEGFARVIAEDLVNEDLLFLGTEFGLYVTLDGGQQWARFKNNLPKVPVHDIAIHPRDGDLIVGTHGRGIYIIDDLTPIRSLTQEALDADVALLDSRPAVMRSAGVADAFGGDADFVGENPSQAANIVYYLKKRHIFGDLKVEIYNQDDELLVTLPGEKRKGINRVAWPMRLQPPKIPAANALVRAFEGPSVPEGSYKVKLIKGKKSYDTTVSLVADPTSPHTAEDRALQQTQALESYAMLERLTYVVESLAEAKADAEKRMKDADGDKKTTQALESFSKQVSELRASMVSTAEGGLFSGEEKLREKLGGLYGSIVSYQGRPTDTQIQRLAFLDKQLIEAEEKFSNLAGAFEAVNKSLSRKKLAPIEWLDKESWKKRSESGGAVSASYSGRDVKLLLRQFPWLSQYLPH